MPSVTALVMMMPAVIHLPVKWNGRQNGCFVALTAGIPAPIILCCVALKKFPGAKKLPSRGQSL